MIKIRCFAKYIIFILAVVQSVEAKTQPNGAKFITAVTVEKTDTAFGVQGLQISYHYNFSSLGKQSYIDSILRVTNYRIKTRVFIKNEAITTDYGYSKFNNSKNEFEITRNLSPLEIKNTKTDNQVTVFIPYAALKLPPLTNYTATVKAALLSTVEITDKQVQLIEQDNINFYKPETLVATVNVDSIEVTTLDSKGRAWDYSFFGKDYPDIGVFIKMADDVLWNKHINNSFLFVLKPNEKNYSFNISKNDRITLLLEDIDLLVNDFIGQFECETADKIKGQWYQVINNNSTIKQCKISYRIN